MSKYVKNFVTGYGITFERRKRNVEAFEKCMVAWREISSNLEVHDHSIIMICGAKNNGKSSLLRYLINSYNHDPNAFRNSNQTKTSGSSMQQSDDEIPDIDDNDDDQQPDDLQDRFAYLIDFDPGQPELTTPGMVSAHLIRATKPELEIPTYMNLMQHDQLIASSVGGTNMSVNPRVYIDNSRFVFAQVIEHRNSSKVKRPIFINTMGHIRNVGLAMLMDLIKICQPTNLIVLNVETDPMRTIYADLSPATISKTRASFYYEVNHDLNTKLDYKQDVIDLQFSFTDATSTAMQNRTALQLAYIAHIPEAMYKPVMQVEPKWLSLDNIAIHCVSSYPLNEEIVFELLHHSWVHLVSLGKQRNRVPEQNGNLGTESREHETTKCKMIDNFSENTLIGCAIVSQIDFDSRRIAVITPVIQEKLASEVDCIIKPLSIQVPHELIKDSYFDPQ